MDNKHVNVMYVNEREAVRFDDLAVRTDEPANSPSAAYRLTSGTLRGFDTRTLVHIMDLNVSADFN
jgi:hypothetical protein